MEKDVFYRGTPRASPITLLIPRSHGLKFALLAALLIMGAIFMLDPGKQWPEKMKKVDGKKVPLEAHIM